VPTPGPTPAPTPVPHQLGGIFTRPHIGLVAERGPEAIIPLAKIASGLVPGRGLETIGPISKVASQLIPKDAIRETLLLAKAGADNSIVQLNAPVGKTIGAPGHTINVSAPVTINGPSPEQEGNLSAILAEHAHTIAREVLPALAIEYEQQAVV
jgi:hypothetical protein